MSNSATTNRGAQYFTPPDSVLYSWSVGGGATYDRWDLDLAFQYSGGNGRIPVRDGWCNAGQPVKVGCPGRYGVTSLFFALSFTVRIGTLRGGPIEVEGIVHEEEEDAFETSEPAQEEETGSEDLEVTDDDLDDLDDDDLDDEGSASDFRARRRSGRDDD